jgi:putative transposase
MAIVSKAEREQAEARRLAAAELFAGGVAQADVARRLGVTTTAVCKWHKRWLDKGADGLRSKGSPGYPRLLSEQQHRELVEVLNAGPAAVGFTGGWALARVATVVRRRFGVRYRYPSAVASLLHRLGFSVQRPARRAIERDEQAIADWRTHTWTQLVEPPEPADQETPLIPTRPPRCAGRRRCGVGAKRGGLLGEQLSVPPKQVEQHA